MLLDGACVGVVGRFRAGPVAAVGVVGKWMRILAAATEDDLSGADWPRVRGAVREELAIPTDQQLRIDILTGGRGA